MKGVDPDYLLDDLLCRARIAGADEADVLFHHHQGITASQRLETPEKLTRSEKIVLGLRVIVGLRQACVSSSDLGAAMRGDMVERAVAMARSAPEDSCCGLAKAEYLANKGAALDLNEDGEPSMEDVAARAQRIEAAALSVPGVNNSEGVEVEWTRNHWVLAASNGFRAHHTMSRHAFMVSVLAGQGQEMERDYEFSSATHIEDLGDLEEKGRSTGERAVKRLRPRKIPTCQVPVVFHPRVARSLLEHFVSAIDGSKIALGTSFLKDKRGQRIFRPEVSIIDDPSRHRGLRSRLYDSEGLPCRHQMIVDEGFLRTWLLDLNSARRLDLPGTGHGMRGLQSLPAPSASNLYFAPGPASPRDLLATIDEGFYVTELMGLAISMTSGDYSRGASGFWIEKGELTYPVSQVTIAGNLMNMFANLDVADDLAFRFGLDAPTVHVGVMTVAGL